jgi:hypothetical protein
VARKEKGEWQMKTKGMFWHVHHDKLVEYCYSYKERADYIRKEKPKKEIGIRLRLFKLVRGKLPVEWVRAWEAYVEARKAYDRAWKVYEKARKAWDKAWKAWDKAWQVYEKARKAWDKAWEAFVNVEEACKDKIEALHKKECPNCPWDGKRIRFE